MLYPGITQEVAPDESQRGPKPKTSADGTKVAVCSVLRKDEIARYALHGALTVREAETIWETAT